MNNGYIYIFELCSIFCHKKFCLEPCTCKVSLQLVNNMASPLLLFCQIILLHCNCIALMHIVVQNGFEFAPVFLVCRIKDMCYHIQQ